MSQKRKKKKKKQKMQMRRQRKTMVPMWPNESVHSVLKAADELQSYLDIHGDDCHHQSLLHIKCLIT